MVDKCFCIPIEQINSVIGSDPERTRPILHNHIDIIVIQAIRIRWIMLVMSECFRVPIKQIESLTCCANPERARLILAYCLYPIVTQAMGIFRIMLIAEKSLGFLVKTIQSAFCTNPQNSCPVLVYQINKIMPYRCWIVGVVPIMGESPCLSVKAIQSAAIGADPERSAPVLKNRVDTVMA
ncbi:hypothetical protein QUF58_00335 [Anaerolineales bacterium HSG24]|nr:hypothetical protein [Anaerolineales bacterium HSG24]